MIDYKKKLTQALASHEFVTKQRDEEKTTLDKARATLQSTLTAQKITQEIAEELQNQAHSQISSIVSRCLEAVFGEEAYTFLVKFKQSRGKTEAELLLLKQGASVEQAIDAIDSAGGGVVDVVSFALRLACLVLTRPKKRQLLVMDEPFKHLSKEYRPAVRDLLLTLSRELNVQMIIVTHDPVLQIGKVVEL